MTTENHVLNFMDLMDLDEDVVDDRLKDIMRRSSFTNKHLISILHLLKYKHLINLQEDTECDNNEEFNFIVKLINCMTSENIDYVCKITYYILNLNKTSLVSKSEHLVQQILSNIYINKEWTENDSELDSMEKLLNTFKLCESVLDAVIVNGEKISLLFLEIPLENITSIPQDKIVGHFLTNTVPKLFESVIEYNILDRIWNHLKTLKNSNKNSLKVLSCLSEFYLPIPNDKGSIKFTSEVVFQLEFWNLLLSGLNSNNPSNRKLAAYLIKRTLDTIISLNTDVTINTEMETIFFWNNKNGIHMKQKWDDFFILIDSLEEKQSNIVMPSLKLFDSLIEIPVCWLNCAFNMGLKHDNTLIRIKCIEHRLKIPLNKEEDAIIMLEAMNDINIYDHSKERRCIIEKLLLYLEIVQNLIKVIKAIPRIKWSPVPLYYLSSVLSTIKTDLEMINPTLLCQIIDDIMKVPCNNIAIRKAVQINISNFIGNCCINLHWKDILTILPVKISFISKSANNPLISTLACFEFHENDKQDFYKITANSYQYSSIVLRYLEHHENDVNVFISVVKEKIDNIKNIVNRQYADKTECFNDLLFIAAMCTETSKHDNEINNVIKRVITNDSKSIAQYLINLLICDNNLEVIKIKSLAKVFDSNIFNYNTKEIFLEIYKKATLLLKDGNIDINKRIFSIYLFNVIGKNIDVIENYKHEILNIAKFLDVINGVELKEVNLDDNGRLRNSYYEKVCETVYDLVKKDEKTELNLEKIKAFIEHALDCGGYGCLLWILKIMNKVTPTLINHDKVQFDMIQFIKRVWKEIEELKSNNQYTPCIEEFVSLINQEELLKKSMYNNVVTLYSSKIIEYGTLKNTPLYYLAKKLNEKSLTEDYGQIISVLCEVLLYNPVVRKDQRVLENVSVEILKEPKYCLERNDIDTHFNFEIQLLAISSLTKINNAAILKTIVSFLIKKIEDMFKNKPRYHGKSLSHKVLLISVQHLLLISLLNHKVVDEKVVEWCIDFLGRLPHQPSVRICLEWLIAIHFYVQKQQLNDEFLQRLKSKNIPLPSQFIILYWILKQKLKTDYCVKEFEFVMDKLLSHTMGQMFNIRLHAQYLSTILYKENNHDKYKYIIKIIEDTFIESSKDKNFTKLQEDYFANDFNILSDLTPCFIYYFLPKYCDMSANENIDFMNLKQTLKIANSNIEKETKDELKRDWLQVRKSDEEVFNISFNKTLAVDEDVTGSESKTIQKKYIPWKNMSDIDIYATEKKLESPSELIVVASLIDKLPNLGGMARTSEVFGVKTYVVDSLRHLQDKQFQGLSVSAERWVNIEEIRPGQPLKDYLMMMKKGGYSIVAAEQTSNSCLLQTFKFPKKTLLLLGHEKEGVPCDLLPIMDHCVEIPQLGFVRSLNVHVTASIFIWEYTKQNIL